MFIAFLYMFRAIMCPSSGENTVPMRRLVLVTLKQVDSLKLREFLTINLLKSLHQPKRPLSFKHIHKLCIHTYTQTKNKSLKIIV